MSDLEQRLTDALTEGAPGRAVRDRSGRRGPGAGPTQASQPHRWRRALRLAVAVPGAVAARGGGDPRLQDVGPADHGNTAVDKNRDDDGQTASRAWPAATNGRAGTA